MKAIFYQSCSAAALLIAAPVSAQVVQGMATPTPTISPGTATSDGPGVRAADSIPIYSVGDVS
ncbi:MAG: hypothetical protein EOO77_09900, partial [Oxalobacteraceae bacterium]